MTPAPLETAMTIDLRREVERALDRNGLVEAGWTTEAIEEAMAGNYETSRFSKLEAAVVMPFIDAIARERDGLREALDAARDAFLNMVADAKQWEFETDGDADDEGRMYSWTTVTMVSDQSQVRELCDALGMTGPYDELIEDRIQRYVDAPVAPRQALQAGEKG